MSLLNKNKYIPSAAAGTIWVPHRAEQNIKYKFNKHKMNSRMKLVTEKKENLEKAQSVHLARGTEEDNFSHEGFSFEDAHHIQIYDKTT